MTFDLEKVVFNTFVTQSCGIPGVTFNPFHLKFLESRPKSLFLAVRFWQYQINQVSRESGRICGHQ